MTSTRSTRVATSVVAAVLLFALAGCGSGSDFENEPRPPITLQVTGVITTDRVTISPDTFGAGPVIITMSNQSDESHTVTLEGEEVTEEIGPINPRDTASLQQTLAEGTYEVRADSEEGVFSDIDPAELTVKPSRQSGSDDVLLP